MPQRALGQGKCPIVISYVSKDRNNSSNNNSNNNAVQTTIGLTTCIWFSYADTLMNRLS